MKRYSVYVRNDDQTPAIVRGAWPAIVSNRPDRLTGYSAYLLASQALKEGRGVIHVAQRATSSLKEEIEIPIEALTPAGFASGFVTGWRGMTRRETEFGNVVTYDNFFLPYDVIFAPDPEVLTLTALTGLRSVGYDTVQITPNTGEIRAFAFGEGDEIINAATLPIPHPRCHITTKLLQLDLLVAVKFFEQNLS